MEYLGICDHPSSFLTEGRRLSYSTCQARDWLCQTPWSCHILQPKLHFYHPSFMPARLSLWDQFICWNTAHRYKYGVVSVSHTTLYPWEKLEQNIFFYRNIYFKQSRDTIFFFLVFFCMFLCVWPVHSVLGITYWGKQAWINLSALTKDGDRRVQLRVSCQSTITNIIWICISPKEQYFRLSRWPDPWGPGVAN